MANMLPSSSYDAFYVQHAGGADPTVSGRAHSPNGYRSYPASMVSGGPSDVAHALPHHHQQQHHAQPVAAHSHNGHLFSHHANFGTQQSWPMSHTSSASTSKEPFASSLNHSPWTAGGLDQVHLPGADGGHDGQLYAPYTGTSGVNWGTPFATAPFDQQLVSPDEAGGLLLSNYELDIIGDDSGSGGMTRPKPKKRRKTAKALREEAQAHFKTQQLQSAEQAAGSLVLDDDVAIGQDVGGADELGGSGHEQISYEPGGGTVDDDGNGSYQESSEFGALHQGMDGTEDEPLYVNPKQYNRILKRREVRARMEEKRRRTEEAIRTGKLDVNRFVGSKDAARVNLDDADEKKSYQHESRHKHAMRRPRGPGGRFLTADEIKAKEAAEAQESEARQRGTADKANGHDLSHVHHGASSHPTTASSFFADLHTDDTGDPPPEDNYEDLLNLE